MTEWWMEKVIWQSATAYTQEAITAVMGVPIGTSYEETKKLNAKEIADIYGLPSTVMGEPFSKYDGQRIPKPHECPHCFRQTHPEPLTQRQARMYDSHSFDASYDAAQDDSPVLCIGADYQGPAVKSPTYSNAGYYYWPQAQYTYTYSQMMKQMTSKVDADLWQVIMGGHESVSVKTWLPSDDQYLPVGESQPTDCEKLPIKFNDPENWKPWEPAPKDWYPVSPALDIKWEDWHTSFPTPDSPGYDFSAFKTPETSGPKKGKQK